MLFSDDGPAPEVEAVAESEPEKAKITAEKETEKLATAQTSQSVKPTISSSESHMGDVRVVDGEKHIGQRRRRFALFRKQRFHPDAAVKRIFSLCAEGKGPNQIARLLTKEQILVENVHEPLITQQQWDIVQDVRKHKKRMPKQMEEPQYVLRTGVLRRLQKDDGPTQGTHDEGDAEQLYVLHIQEKRQGRMLRHYLREQDLLRIVLDGLRRVKHFARQKERLFAEYINQKNSLELRREINSVQKELDAMRRRNTELTALFKRLYEDNVLGLVTSEQFRILSGDYNTEQKELNASILVKETRLEKLQASAANVEIFIEKAKRYTDIPELTPKLLRLFVSGLSLGNAAKNTLTVPNRTSASSTGTWGLLTRWSRWRLANRNLKN